MRKVTRIRIFFPVTAAAFSLPQSETRRPRRVLFSDFAQSSRFSLLPCKKWRKVYFAGACLFVVDNSYFVMMQDIFQLCIVSTITCFLPLYYIFPLGISPLHIKILSRGRERHGWRQEGASKYVM